MNQKEYQMSRQIVGVKFYKESRNKSMDNIIKIFESCPLEILNNLSDTTYYYTTDIDDLKKLDCVVVQGGNTITMVVVVEPNVTHKEGQKAFRNVIAKLSFSNSIMDIAAKANECKLIKDIFTNLVIVKTETNMHSKTCSLKNIKKTIEKLEKHYEQH